MDPLQHLPKLDNPLAVVVGSAALPLMSQWPQFATPTTSFGRAVGPLWIGEVAGRDLVVMPRHGVPHRLAPHQVNYRAVIDTLCQLGVRDVLASHTVGGIDPSLKPGAYAVPTQVIDYTYGREHTFYGDAPVDHVEFGEPFTPRLREALLAAGAELDIQVEPSGTYGCTQGPRFETAAEIQRMARDGATLVGMTAMPEASLAAERGLSYASLCLVVNPAAGVVAEPIAVDEVRAIAHAAAPGLEQLLLAGLKHLVLS